MAQNNKEEPIEKQLWKAADKLRKNIDAAEYKHIVLGLIFLKYISDAFEAHYEKLKKGEGEYLGADPEDRDEYKAENIFFVPPSARWTYLQKRAKLPEIGKDIDAAMDAIERDNPTPIGTIPKSAITFMPVVLLLRVPPSMIPDPQPNVNHPLPFSVARGCTCV